MTPPDESGFILERVPVRNIQEVWGILEVRWRPDKSVCRRSNECLPQQIVREQSWLNETLLACQWIPETMKDPDAFEMEDLDVADDELRAVLSGD